MNLGITLNHVYLVTAGLLIAEKLYTPPSPSFNVIEPGTPLYIGLSVTPSMGCVYCATDPFFLLFY